MIDFMRKLPASLWLKNVLPMRTLGNGNLETAAKAVIKAQSWQRGVISNRGSVMSLFEDVALKVSPFCFYFRYPVFNSNGGRINAVASFKYF